MKKAISLILLIFIIVTALCSCGSPDIEGAENFAIEQARKYFNNVMVPVIDHQDGMKDASLEEITVKSSEYHNDYYEIWVAIEYKCYVYLAYTNSYLPRTDTRNIVYEIKSSGGSFKVKARTVEGERYEYD